MSEAKEKIKGLDGMPIVEVLGLLDSMGKFGELEGIPGWEIESRNPESVALNVERWNKDLKRWQREEIEEKMERLWTEPNRLKPSGRSACELYKGWTRREKYGVCALEIDHSRVWNQDGRLVCVTTEPYHLERRKLQLALYLCDEKGLAGYVHYQAEVHGPNDCIGIVFVRKGDEGKIPTLAAAIKARGSK